MTQLLPLNRRVSVAPMMDYTDRHCRFLMRLISPTALLYTEMVTAQAVLHGDTSRLLGFSPQEQPVALQLGGSQPEELAAAARIGEQMGYQEINLNCGCPSDRVQSGRFGACLMAEPEVVRDAVIAMRSAVSIPVSVKCRIGIEPGMAGRSDDQFLAQFIDTVAESGCTEFVVHARRAVLKGLSPKENREIPPLQYEVVYRLKRAKPHLSIVLNGGVKTVADAQAHWAQVDGVMIGREAYQNPYLLAELHRCLVPTASLPDRAAVVTAYAAYVAERLEAGDRLPAMVRPLLGLYFGLPRARSWRRMLSEQARQAGADARLLSASLRMVAAET